MKYKKYKVLEGTNIKGKEKLLYIAFDKNSKKQVQDMINVYQRVCNNLKFKSRVVDIEEHDNKVEVYIAYDNVNICKAIIDGVINSEGVEEIRTKVAGVYKEEWFFSLNQLCDLNDIPLIKIDDYEVQLGYGINSIKINYEEYSSIYNKNNEEIINNLKCKSDGIIPIIAVTGTNGKTTTVRLIHNILLSLGYKSGLSSTGGIYFGKQVIKHGDTTGFYSAREILKNSNVEVAVLETARGGILKKGLGYKKAKVAIITSVSEDHIGLEGVKSVNDLLNIKSVIANELDSDGILVVKAIDILFDRFKDKDNVIFFDYNKNEVIDKHIKSGKSAFYVENDIIVKNNGGRITEIISIKDIPFAFGGISKSNIKNVIVAIIAVNSIHKNLEEVKNVLKEIKCDIYTNLGRQNIIDFGRFKLMIDYGHNSEAFNEVFAIAKGLKPTKVTGVITAAGDRTDKYIKELGEITSKYCDKIIVKEQPDLRGRDQGETAYLLKDGALKEGFKDDNIKIILPEGEAVLAALNEAIDGEVIVSFSQFLYLTMPVINEYRKEHGLEPIGEDLDLSH